MTDCSCLIHPFQNDPGTSQNQRVMDELLAGAVKIDARTMADLLDYFVQLSRHINYYDLALNVGDWQPFFISSIPFTLAAVIKYPVSTVESNFTLYNSLFERRPAVTGLQLTAWFLFYRFINRINKWHLTLKNSSLPAEATLDALIRNKLQDPVKKYIQFVNAAVKIYGINRIDFTPLLQNEVWNLDLSDLYTMDTSFRNGTTSKIKRINNLYRNFKALFPVFLESVKSMAAACENDLELSFVPLKEELQKNHPPHLALLFTFLNLFRHLQDDLNRYTRKHLDFFYSEILRFIPREANPDKAYVIFEIQKQLEKYLVSKGLRLKNGKDDKKQEILFALDDEIVVNKTQVADTRALFINNRIIDDTAYVEGVYMAPDLTMADGVDKPFRDDQPPGFPTMGGRESKYVLPGAGLVKPYPHARIGFILASHVLLLNEGTRTVTITLQCELDASLCNTLAAQESPGSEGCCDETKKTGKTDRPEYPEFLPPETLIQGVEEALNTSFYYISEEMIPELIKKGIGSNLIRRLRENFLTEKKEACYCETVIPKYETIEKESDFEAVFKPDEPEFAIITQVIKKRRPLTLLFSGEKEWIEPSKTGIIRIKTSSGFPDRFELKIPAVLNPDKPAVTFYSKDKLGEDLNTTLPLVKIELDDHFSMVHPLNQDDIVDQCCLDRKSNEKVTLLSLYHFLRNAKVVGKTGKNPNVHTDETQIGVEVCGLRNFVVQNDESVLDVNGQIVPFGSRPKIDANFYLGPEEIFLKSWQKIFINLNWKDKPDDFEEYYIAYQTHLLGNPPSNVVKEDDFKIQLAILQDGKWIPWKHCRISPFDINCGNNSDKCKLFQDFVSTGIDCSDNQNYSHQFSIVRKNDFAPVLHEPLEDIRYQGLTKFDVNSRHSFIRITLKCQDFQHEIYPFILARQMMAFGKLPETVDGAVYYSPSSTSPIVFDSTKIKEDVNNAHTIALRVNDDVNNNTDGIVPQIPASGDITGSNADQIRKIVFPASITNPGGKNLEGDASQLHTLIHQVNDRIAEISSLAAIIPNEPWNPVISNMAIDYTASAAFTDISLIHLYPFAGTFKHEKIESKPALFPTFCDEGTLYLGLKDLVPGNNLNILFRMAEATSDSESDKEPVFWYYLENNQWKSLREGFEVLDDDTKNLTSTGIIKFAMPANMTKDNSVMPKGLHWIKAAIARNSRVVSETIGIHAQAIGITFTNGEANDKLRLSKPLPAGSISKLEVADASVKSISQPYETFGGSVPEIESAFYVRVSEQLRHKGRAIQAFDYERLVLEAYPQLFKVKCINHSFALNAHQTMNDYPYAPGYIILALIPDLYRLNAGNSVEPKLPVSTIEDIEAFVRKRTSPFVRFRAMNPRYERVNFCLRIKLVKGKDENFYREKIRQDITEFLAPWAVGKYDKLTFGQCVYRSDIIRLLENTDYVEFITDLRMGKEHEVPDRKYARICPETPRSILIAGETDICIEGPGCEDWGSYEKCDGEILEGCDTRPEPIVNYCK